MLGKIIQTLSNGTWTTDQQLSQRQRQRQANQRTGRLRCWVVQGEATGPHGPVAAATKSEARAVLKKQRGLRRLPIGTKLVEVT